MNGSDWHIYKTFTAHSGAIYSMIHLKSTNLLVSGSSTGENIIIAPTPTTAADLTSAACCSFVCVLFDHTRLGSVHYVQQY